MFKLTLDDEESCLKHVESGSMRFIMFHTVRIVKNEQGSTKTSSIASFVIFGEVRSKRNFKQLRGKGFKTDLLQIRIFEKFNIKLCNRVFVAKIYFSSTLACIPFRKSPRFKGGARSEGGAGTITERRVGGGARCSPIPEVF